MPEPTPIFVSPDHFASLTSLGLRTVRRLLASGEVPSVKVGSRRLIPLNRAISLLGATDSDAVATAPRSFPKPKIYR